MNNYRKTLTSIFFVLNTCTTVFFSSANANSQILEDPTNNIVGGVETEKNEFPFMVKIGRCGGSIIDDYHVLTAAHCIPYPKKNLSIIFGEHNKTEDESEQYASVSNIFVHRDYNFAALKNDIVIVRVKDRIDSKFKPITLSNELYLQPGTMATAAGWGKIFETGKSSDTLQKVDLPIVSNEQCRNAKLSENRSIRDSNICAGFEYGEKDTCGGDSGGPLFVKEQGIFFQIGIVSWGVGCARPDKYGVYTRVSSYKNWIEKVISGELDGIWREPEELHNSIPKTFSGIRHSEVELTMNIPSGPLNLELSLTGSTGSVNFRLYKNDVRLKETCRASNEPNSYDKSCSYNLSSAGIYKILLKARDNYSNATITGVY